MHDKMEVGDEKKMEVEDRGWRWIEVDEDEFEKKNWLVSLLGHVNKTFATSSSFSEFLTCETKPKKSSTLNNFI